MGCMYFREEKSAPASRKKIPGLVLAVFALLPSTRLLILDSFHGLRDAWGNASLGPYSCYEISEQGAFCVG